MKPINNRTDFNNSREFVIANACALEMYMNLLISAVPRYVKNTLLRHFAVSDFKTVAFLKSEAPLSYLYAVILVGKQIPPREVNKIVAGAKDEREYGFAMWCLGKLGMWNELLDLNARIPEIEKEFRHARLRRLGVTEFDEFD